MATLITRPITVRGVVYTVSELNGAAMAAVRKMLKNGSEETDLFITLHALTDPKPKNMAEVEQMSNMVVHAVAARALWLTSADDPDGEYPPPKLAKEGEANSQAKKD
ncbi:MAG TPA: hypothetical protein VGL34_25140 [Steroidobacteraceae bacterium]|jgi:hypothetical protein